MSTPTRYRPESLTHGPQTATDYRAEIAVLLGFERQRMPSAFPRDILRTIYHALRGEPAPNSRPLAALRATIAYDLDLPDPERFNRRSANFRKADVTVIYDHLQTLDPATLAELRDQTTCPDCDRTIVAVQDHGKSLSLATTDVDDTACLGVEKGRLVEYIHRD